MSVDRLRALASQLQASPAELAGLVVLLVGAAGVTLALWWSAPPAGPATAGPAELSGLPTGEVTVHVSGAVTAAGIVTLPDGARVVDAIAATGGATPDADLDALNLARPLQDGEQVLVPRAGASLDVAGDAGAGAVTADGRVDLNRATTSELETLPGVGPVLAGRIVAWREEHGPFVEVGQLREVSGIGERSFQTLVDLVIVR